MHITAKKETALKIDETVTQEWRDAYNIPDNDAIDEAGNLLAAGTKRERRASTVVKEPKLKAARVR